MSRSPDARSEVFLSPSRGAYNAMLFHPALSAPSCASPFAAPRELPFQRSSCLFSPWKHGHLSRSPQLPLMVLGHRLGKMASGPTGC